MIRLKRLYANNFKQLQEIELRFPDAARILVQGRNEAGKSTLFEAVFFALFGGALASEMGGRGLDALIAYGTEKARVELDVACGERLFKITRTIVREKANVWELEIERGDAPPEIVRGNSVVNKRLVAELGFDGEALLNTCFVEQKKLEKLEGLSRAKREESLAKLLNLDTVVDLENDLKVRAEDRQELERLKRRTELADIQGELPEREAGLGKVESKLRLIELRRAVEGATNELRVVEQLEKTVAALEHKRESLAGRAERIDALKEAMLCVKDARDAAERIAENQQEIERLEMERNEAAQGPQDTTQLAERARSLKRLIHWTRRIDQVRLALESHSQRATTLSGMQARLIELGTTVAQEEDKLAKLEAALHGYQVGEALGRWVAAKQAVLPQNQIDGGAKERKQEREYLSRRFRIEVYGLAGLLLFFVLAGLLFQPLSAMFIALAAITLVALAVRVTLLWRELGKASEALGRAEGEAGAKAAENQLRIAEVERAEDGIKQLGLPVPETVDLAQSRRAEIARMMDNRTAEDLRTEQEATRERLSSARAVLHELQQQNAIERVDVIQRELEECQRRAEKAGLVVERCHARLEAAARSLQIEAEAGAIQRALYKVDAEANQVQKRAEQVAKLGGEIKRHREQAATLQERARKAFETARVVKSTAVEWNSHLGVQAYTTFGKELRSEYDALGGEAIIKQAREVEGELGRRQGERDTRRKNASVLVKKTQDLLADMNQADRLGENPKLDELEELRARFGSIDLGDENGLRIQERDLVGRIHSLRDRQTQLERDLGLAGQALDAKACRAEMEEKAQQMLVRERGVEIISVARRRIVQKVLPATMDYMRMILPTLTEDRYHDAQLDPETYKIQVWDERAGSGGAFKEKNIFSGGTKDQFSLALRLAFALATLPQERGTAPSFIFLDEPLGSFDQERAEALIYLLTEGEIARAFDQIFLISHVHVDERLFTHRVILENGRVSFSDLPT